jgi:regulatory protein
VADAYTDAVKMLARRELSEAQLRQRLARRSHAAPAIDAAVVRLRDERAIDDARVAELIARAQLAKSRGELRVRRRIEQAGISPETARRVARELFAGTDPDALVEASLAKRLKRRHIANDREFQRLYRYLVNQGFDAGSAIRALERRTNVRGPSET